MIDEAREDYLNMLRYFWEEKDDLERYCAFDRDRMAREFPEVLKAWDDYKLARKMLSAVLRGVE